MKVAQLSNGSDINCGNDLNLALERIVNDCTRTLSIKSDYRIRKTHVNRELILAIRERDRLFHLQGLYPENIQLAQLYIDKAIFVKMNNERLKAEFYTNKLEDASGDARKTWKVYKEIVFNQHERKQDHTITINGIPTNGSSDSCNAVNEHFCTAGEHLATTIIAIHGYDVDDIEELYPEHSSNNWSFKETDSHEVKSTINKLTNKKSTGVDNVPMQLIKATSNLIAPLIALCFNIAVWSTIYPFELLKGRLKLIHKSGDCDIENFRGITLLPVLSKVFESILYEQLVAYLNDINFFRGFQFGFLRNSSCCALGRHSNWLTSSKPISGETEEKGKRTSRAFSWI